MSSREDIQRLIGIFDGILDGMEADVADARQLEERNPVLFRGAVEQAMRMVREVQDFRDHYLGVLHDMEAAA